MKKLHLAFAVAVLAVVATFTVSTPASAADKASVKIKNNSKWAIHHLYLSSTSDEKWGPDQLGDEVINTGESFTLKNIDPDKYDVKLVDEDGDECVVGGVPLSGGTDVWNITDKDLLKCQKASQ